MVIGESAVDAKIMSTLLIGVCVLAKKLGGLESLRTKLGPSVAAPLFKFVMPQSIYKTPYKNRLLVKYLSICDEDSSIFLDGLIGFSSVPKRPNISSILSLILVLFHVLDCISSNCTEICSQMFKQLIDYII